MEDDIRCCGTGTCLINAEGFCWCGQQWDGTKMCFAPQPSAGSSSGKTQQGNEKNPDAERPPA